MAIEVAKVELKNVQDASVLLVMDKLILNLSSASWRNIIIKDGQCLNGSVR